MVDARCSEFCSEKRLFCFSRDTQALPGASPRAAEPRPHRVLYWGLHAQSLNYREGVGVDNILVFFVRLFSVVNIVRIVTEPNT